MLVFLKVLLTILVIIILAPFQYIFIKFKLKYRTYLPIIFHRTVLKILGVKVKLLGNKTDLRPLVLVGNHTSYLDIIILGSIMPISFIAKEEIKDWFLFGFWQNAKHIL